MDNLQQMVVAPPGPRPHYTLTDLGWVPLSVAGGVVKLRMRVSECVCGQEGH
jgi:hypothetical protein